MRLRCPDERTVANDEAAVLAREYVRRAMRGLREVARDVQYGGIARFEDAVRSIDDQIALLVRARTHIEKTQWAPSDVNDDGIPF